MDDKMRIHAALIVWFASVTLTSPIYAQGAESVRWQAFVKSDTYRNLIRNALMRVPSTVFPRCPNLVSGGSKAIALKPISFGENGIPNGGAWKEMLPFSGCGNDTILNFYFNVASDGKINTLLGFPGTSQADLTLQRDAFPHAHSGASFQVKDCKFFLVKNVRFEGYGLKTPSLPDPGASARFRPWWETWTMAGCEKVAEVTMNFVPDENGTKITTVTAMPTQR